LRAIDNEEALYNCGNMVENIEKSDLHKIAEILIRHGVEFIVIGGQAETILGSPRITYDVDLCYRRSSQNLQRLAEALKEIGPTLRGAPPDLPVILDVRALSLGNNYTFETPFGKLDLLGWVEPLGDYEAVNRHADDYQIGPHKLKVISLDDLIRVKEHIGRSKDRESLFQLLAIKRLRQEEGKS
jgi:predicted nucleotidyltransferase